MAELRRRWAREVPDAQVTVFGAAPVPGLGSAGGFKFMVEDRGGLGVRSLELRMDDLVLGFKKLGTFKITDGERPRDRRAEARTLKDQVFVWKGLEDAVGTLLDKDEAVPETDPGQCRQRAHPGGRQDPVPIPHSPVAPGGGPDQGRLDGGVAPGPEPDREHVPRVAVREQLQRLRPPLAGDRAGGRRLPRPARTDPPVPGPQQFGADGPAQHAREGPRPRRADHRDAVQPVHRRVHQRERPARRERRRRHQGDQRRGERHAPALDAARVDRTHVHATAGREHGDLRVHAVGPERVPRARGAVRELDAAAGRDPGRAAVPVVFGGRGAVRGQPT